jgi:FkbM family methyltransferase
MAIAKVLSRSVRFQRRLFGLDPDVRVTRSGVRWNLDLREGIDLSIYLFGLFESDTVRAYRKLVRPGDHVLDIGANIGAHTLHLARSVGPSGRVIAVEPTAYAYDKLVRLLDDNRPLSNVVVSRQVMLTNRTGSELPDELYSSWSVEESEGRHELLQAVGKTTRGARSVTLDDLVQGEGLERIDLIKLDVDGWEMDVLRGAARTLSELKPTLVFELCPHVLEERGHGGQELLDALASHGYRFSTLADKPVADVKRLLLGIPKGAGVNLIARAR